MNDSKQILDWNNVVKKRMKFPEFEKKLYLDKNLQLPFSTLSLAKYLNRVAIKELNWQFSVTFLFIYFLVVLLDYDYSCYLCYMGLLTFPGLIFLTPLGSFPSSLSVLLTLVIFRPLPKAFSAGLIHPIAPVTRMCRWYLYYLGRFWWQISEDPVMT